MKVLFESDRECTLDTVGLLEPGIPVEGDASAFENHFGYSPAKANLPSFVKVTYVLDDPAPAEGSEGGE